jgi:ketosteroid isomerase-like protein
LLARRAYSSIASTQARSSSSRSAIADRFYPLSKIPSRNTGLVSAEAEFEVVRETWRAFSRDDYEAALEHIHPDAIVIPFGAAMEGRQYAGHEQIMDWMLGEIRSNWERFETDPQEFRKVGDKLLVYGWWRARGRDSGVELEVAATWVVEVRDGKIGFWQTFTDRTEALRFVGLRE